MNPSSHTDLASIAADGGLHGPVGTECDSSFDVVERIAADGGLHGPVETSGDQQKRIPVGQLKLHMNLMIVHPAIQNELILGRPLEGEARPPVLVVTLREGESSLREIDGGAIRSERIVYALKGHPVGVSIEDGAPPTGGVGEE